MKIAITKTFFPICTNLLRVSQERLFSKETNSITHFVTTYLKENSSSKNNVLQNLFKESVSKQEGKFPVKELFREVMGHARNTDSPLHKIVIENFPIPCDVSHELFEKSLEFLTVKLDDLLVDTSERVNAVQVLTTRLWAIGNSDITDEQNEILDALLKQLKASSYSEVKEKISTELFGGLFTKQCNPRHALCTYLANVYVRLLKSSETPINIRLALARLLPDNRDLKEIEESLFGTTVDKFLQDILESELQKNIPQVLLELYYEKLKNRTSFSKRISSEDPLQKFLVSKICSNEPLKVKNIHLNALLDLCHRSASYESKTKIEELVNESNEYKKDYKVEYMGEDALDDSSKLSFTYLDDNSKLEKIAQRLLDLSDIHLLE